MHVSLSTTAWMKLVLWMGKIKKAFIFKIKAAGAAA